MSNWEVPRNIFLLKEDNDKPKKGIFVKLDDIPIFFVYDGVYYELDGSRLLGGLLQRGVVRIWEPEHETEFDPDTGQKWGE